MKTLKHPERLVLILPVVAVAVIVSQFAVAQDSGGKDYVGVSQCKVCHNKKEEGAQYDKWKEMNHAHAFELLSSDAALEVAKARGMSEKPSEAAECLKCHVTSYDPETKTIHPKLKMEEGVQCESCHGPASAHMDDGKAIMMKKGEGIDVLANIVKPTAANCTQCHNEESPTWNPEKYTLENGDKVGFDFDQAYAKISHNKPE